MDFAGFEPALLSYFYASSHLYGKSKKKTSKGLEEVFVMQVKEIILPETNFQS